MNRFIRAMVAATLLLGARAFLQAETKEQKATDRATAIEFSKPLPKAHFRGTVGYLRTEREAPFLAQVNEEPIDRWAGTQVPPAQGEKPDPKKEAAEKAAQEDAKRKADAYRLADRTNPRWLALRKIGGSDVYNPHPTTEFYEQVLGKRDAPNTSKPSEIQPKRD